ncbi:MAG: hypothetical protein JNL74_09115 [Fibrobacteres bacterium]|nr:hypothetical protein [Fibrobacterota bacterium]
MENKEENISKEEINRRAMARLFGPYDYNSYFRSLYESGDDTEEPDTVEICKSFYRYLAGRGVTFTYNVARQCVSLHLENAIVELHPENPTSRAFLLTQLQKYSPHSPKGKEFMLSFNDFMLHEERSRKISTQYYCHYDTNKNICYYYVDDKYILEIAETETRLIQNGSEVGLNAPMLKTNPWVFDPSVDIHYGLSRLLQNYTNNLALDENDRIVSTAFNLAQMLPGLFIRPLRENVGSSSAGKSSEALLWSSLIYAEIHLQNFNNQYELAACSDTNPFVVVDNLEDKQASHFFEFFCVGPTGGSLSRRKLFFSDSVVLSYKMNGQITKTCIRGATEPEILNRTVTFEFDLEHHTNLGFNLEDVKRDIVNDRSIILSTIFKLAPTTVLQYRKRRDCFADLYLLTKKHPRRRLNPFFREMILWMKVICDHLSKDWKTVADAFFGKSETQYNIDTADSSMVVHYLRELIHTREKSIVFGASDFKTDYNSKGGMTFIEGHAADFFYDFKKIDRNYVITYFRNAKGLGQRMKSLESEVLAPIGIHLERDKRFRNRGILYKFVCTDPEWRKWDKEKGLLVYLEEIFGASVPFETLSQAKELIQKGKLKYLKISSSDFFGTTPEEVFVFLNWLYKKNIPIIIDNGTPIENRNKQQDMVDNKATKTQSDLDIFDIPGFDQFYENKGSVS